MRIVNRKARLEYFILETLEAGVILSGAEVKSIRGGHADLNNSFAKIQNGELYIKNLFIPPYQPSGMKEYDPARDRKLLIRSSQLQSLRGKLEKGGMALVPLAIYGAHNLIKVELGLGQSKKKFDKRRAIKLKDEQRKLDQELKGY